MNPLSHARLVREVLALARALYGWDAHVEVLREECPGTDKIFRKRFRVAVRVWTSTRQFFCTEWREPNNRRWIRPPAERALREAIARLKGYLRIRLDPEERGEILERLAVDHARRRSS